MIIKPKFPALKNNEDNTMITHTQSTSDSIKKQACRFLLVSGLVIVLGHGLYRAVVPLPESTSQINQPMTLTDSKQ